MEMKICKICCQPIGTDCLKVFITDATNTNKEEPKTICPACYKKIHGLFAGSVVMLEREQLQ